MSCNWIIKVWFSSSLKNVGEKWTGISLFQGKDNKFSLIISIKFFEIVFIWIKTQSKKGHEIFNDEVAARGGGVTVGEERRFIPFFD